MKENVLISKSLNFASEIIKLQQFLIKEKRESIISKQIINRVFRNKKDAYFNFKYRKEF